MDTMPIFMQSLFLIINLFQMKNRLYLTASSWRFPLRIGVPSQLSSGNYRLYENRQLFKGSMSSSYIYFTGGQGRLPGFGGDFLFKTSGGASYKINLPPAELKRRWYEKMRIEWIGCQMYAKVRTKLTWDAIRMIPTEEFETIYNYKIDWGELKWKSYYWYYLWLHLV